MVSLHLVRALESSTEHAQSDKSTPRRHRRDWARGEVRCLMCARLVGRLLGSRTRSNSRELSFRKSVKFFAFRSADTTRSIVVFQHIGADQ